MKRHHLAFLSDLRRVTLASVLCVTLASTALTVHAQGLTPTALSLAAAAPAPTATTTAPPTSTSLLTGSVTPMPPTSSPTPPPNSTAVLPTSTTTAVPSTTHTATPSPAATPRPCSTGTMAALLRCIEPSMLRVAARGAGGTRSGTAFVVRADSSGSYALVTDSVVQGISPGRITLTSLDGKAHYAVTTVRAMHARGGGTADLALLRLFPAHMVALAWGNSTQLKVGQAVVSLSAGQAGAAPSVVVDTISALHCDRGDGLGRFWIRHGALTAKSAPGGLLLARDGSVVGLNVQQTAGTGLFAIPAASLKAAVTSMFTVIQAQLPTASPTPTVPPSATASPSATATAIPTATLPPTATATTPPAATATTPPTATASATATAETTTFAASGYTIQLPAGWASTNVGTTLGFRSADNLVTLLAGVFASSPGYAQSDICQTLANSVAEAVIDFANQGMQFTAMSNCQPQSIGLLSGYGLTFTYTKSGVAWTTFIGRGTDGTHNIDVSYSYPATTPDAEIQLAAAMTASIRIT